MPGDWSRRSWMGVLGHTALACVPGAKILARASRDPGRDGLEATIRDEAEKKGLAAFRFVGSDRYLVAGDAEQGFLEAASKLCEGLADDFLEHFRSRGFAIRVPTDQLVVVALSSPSVFAKFEGIELAQAVGGQYDPSTNRLVIFDQRGKAQTGPRDERANTVALMHEATHQLTFNTGLLDRSRDVPLAISEGLGTYGETRRPDGRTKVGAVNAERVQVLATAARGATSWIPLSRLLVEDALFEDAATQQMAYAESWLLVHASMSDEERRASLRRYLEGLAAAPGGAGNRTDAAAASLGDLEALDGTLKQRANRLIRTGARR